MFKRLLLIVALCITLIALSAPVAQAWRGFGCLGFLCGSSCTVWQLKGGDKPGSCYIVGTIQVVDACLVCLNPSNKEQKDVREGLGGITPPLQISTEDNYLLTQNKVKLVNMCFPSSVEEFGLPIFSEFCLAYGDPCDPQVAFEKFYNVDKTSCRNSNWTPSEYIITSAKVVNGQIWCDCTADPGTPGWLESCTPGPQASSVICTTDMQCRNWDCANANYECTEL